MDNDKLSLISSFISKKSGLVFREKNLSALKSAIDKRLAALGYDDILQYYMHLKFDENGQNEIKSLYSLITVNETEFFRDKHRMKALFEKVIPEIVEKKISRSVINGTPPLITIWSAGCSSGEEPFSIAIGLNEMRSHRFFYNVELLATDINSEILAVTNESIYDTRKLKNVDEAIRKKYFTRTDSGFQLVENIRKTVNFRYHNLVEDPVPLSSQRLWDIIVCQNVIIYFDKATIQKVIEQFYNSLVEGGYLILGFSENLHGISDLFTTTYYDKIALHQKLQKKSPVQAAEKPGKPVRKAEPPAPPEPPEKKEISFSYDEAEKLLGNDEIERAREMVEKHLEEHEEDEKAHFLLGRIFLEKSLYSEAELQFKMCLALDCADSSVYYFMGLVHYRLDQPEDVIRFLKKALYLDKENALAHLHLADAYIMTKDLQNARRGYENTIKCLKKHQPEETLPMSKGIRCRSLIETCMKRLRELA